MTETLKTMAMEMYQRKAYNTLKLFKARKKKSWAVLGINPKMKALIMKGAETILTDDITVKGTITGRLPKESKPVTYATQRFVGADLSVLQYTPRDIHQLKGQSSHGSIAIVNQVVHQEKFRADVRFPLFQIMQSVKRYKAIFAGTPYKEIFA